MWKIGCLDIARLDAERTPTNVEQARKLDDLMRLESLEHDAPSTRGEKELERDLDCLQSDRKTM
jgi:hypothetical protein